MHRSLSTLTAIAIGLTLAGPASSQEAAPQDDAAPAGTGAPLAPAPDASTSEGTPPAEAPASEEPAATAPDADVSPQDAGAAAPAEGAPQDAPAAELPTGPDGPTMAGPQEEQAEIRETFGDWAIRCATGTDECVLHQMGTDEDDNPVLEFSLLRVAEGGEASALVNILSPLGTFLPSGITLQVDEGQTRQYGFTFCTGIGCVAQVALTGETVAAMRRGRIATLSLASITAPDQPVEIEISLLGFTDAWNSLTPIEAPAAAAAPAPAPAPEPAPSLPPVQ